MQGSAAATEREARRRLPSLLANLLDEPVVHVDPPHSDDAPQVDLIASDESGRRWVIEIKNSSRPGQVARAAEQLRAYADEGVIPVLVVPFMSRAGAETADRVWLYWIDLSGNAHVRAGNCALVIRTCCLTPGLRTTVSTAMTSCPVTSAAAASSSHGSSPSAWSR